MRCAYACVCPTQPEDAPYRDAYVTLDDIGYPI
jgi:hypothetical protein